MRSTVQLCLTPNRDLKHNIENNEGTLLAHISSLSRTIVPFGAFRGRVRGSWRAEECGIARYRVCGGEVGAVVSTGTRSALRDLGERRKGGGEEEGRGGGRGGRERERKRREGGD